MTPKQWKRRAEGKKVHCMTVEERFWAKVDIRGKDECWPWRGGLLKDGYGQFWLSGCRQAHRVAYELVKGGIGDLLVCHSCDTPACCNPRHLFAGTNSENMLDMVAKGRCPGNGIKRRKLLPSEVELIKKSCLPQSYLAQLFETAQSTVWGIKSGVRYVS